MDFLIREERVTPFQHLQISYVTFLMCNQIKNILFLMNDESKSLLLVSKVTYLDVLTCYSSFVSDNVIPIPQIDSNRHNKRETIHWTEVEKSAIINGIKEFGIGKWKQIYESNQSLFDKNCRKPNDIADKWKNMKNKPQYQNIIN